MKGLLASSIFSTVSLSSRCFRTLKRKLHHDTDEKKEDKKRKLSISASISAPVSNVQSCSGGSGIEFVDSHRAVARIAAGQMLVFDGRAMVCLVEGSGSMHGYTLNRGMEVLVYSCSTLCSALTFQTGDDGCVLQFSSYTLELANDYSISFTLKLVDDPASMDDQNLGTRKRHLTMEDSQEPPKRMRPTIIPSEWSSTVDSIMSCDEPLPVVPICGVQGVGKSTFARFLVNRFLAKYRAVAYLDTDVGQPEFTIAGCLSLHIVREPIIGSPASHLRIPERCFFYGDVTPQTNPQAYLKYFNNLYDYFRQANLCIPLVINTFGWHLGVGQELLLEILRYSGPTHVIEIYYGGVDNLQLPPFPNCSVSSILRLPCAFSYSTEPHHGTAELRALRVLHYFREYAGIRSFAELQVEEIAKALACRAPYQVSTDSINIVHLHIQVPSAHESFSLNAQLVGLGSNTFNKDEIQCVGFGIIRGIDTDKRVLYILTPCPKNVLEGVDTILQGRVEIPVVLLQVKGRMCPYLSTSHVVEGGGSSILRRRLLSQKKKTF